LGRKNDCLDSGARASVGDARFGGMCDVKLFIYLFIFESKKIRCAIYNLYLSQQLFVQNVEEQN
jgi:hypothetical protein